MKDETLRGEGKQSVVKATVLNDCNVCYLGADRKQKAIENIPARTKLSVSASDPTNCLTMLLIETKGGDFADEGVIRRSNYKNMTTGLYELGCGSSQLIVGLI